MNHFTNQSRSRFTRTGVTLALALLGAAVLTLALKLSSGPVTAQAAIYFVDSRNGDDSIGQPTRDRPWRSLSRLGGVSLDAGDAVKLRSGSRWSEPLSITGSGVSGRPVSVSRYGDGRPPVVTGVADCVVISGEYVHVSGIAADRCGNAGFTINGSFNTVRYSRATRSAIGIFASASSSNATISRNYIARNNKMITLTPSPETDDAGAFGVLLHGVAASVAYNTIVGHSAFSHDFGRDGSAVEVYGATFSRIHHNLSTGNLTFVELGHSATADTVISRNTIRSRRPRHSGLITRGPNEEFGPVHRTTFAHNKVILKGRHSAGFICSAGCGPEIATIVGNYFDVNGSGGFADYPPKMSGNKFVNGQLDVESER